MGGPCPGVSFSLKGARCRIRGQNAYNEPNVVSVAVRDRKCPGGKQSIEMPAIIFGGTGSVIWPAGDGELELHLMEGKVVDGVVTGTSVQADEWQKREVIMSSDVRQEEPDIYKPSESEPSNGPQAGLHLDRGDPRDGGDGGFGCH